MKSSFARPAGGADDLFCERCGDPAGPAMTLGRAGLTRCVSCGVFACPRCWARAAPACPGCGTANAIRAVVSGEALSRRVMSRPTAGGPASSAAGAMPAIAASRSRAIRPVTVAVGIVVFAVSTLAFVTGGPIGPRGGVEGVTGTPGPVATSTGRPSGTHPSPVVVGGGHDPTSTPTHERPTSTTRADGTAAPRATRQPTQAPDPTPTRAPTRTPLPTPRPTPRPTPEPTSCVIAAPQLVGERRNNAAGIWRSAGFTGAITALPGNGNYVIKTQDRVAGDEYPCDSDVTIGP